MPPPVSGRRSHGSWYGSAIRSYARTKLYNILMAQELAVRLATDPAFARRTGRFLSTTPGAGLLPATRARHDRDLRRLLWRRSAELVGR